MPDQNIPLEGTIVLRKVLLKRKKSNELFLSMQRLRVEHPILPSIPGKMTAELLYTSPDGFSSIDEPTGRFFLVNQL